MVADILGLKLLNYKKQISIRARRYVMGTPEQSNWGTGPVQSTLKGSDSSK